ncbi:MAG: hypothetical protein M3142_04770, partial [Bacteroidota bacterium]|nr:hypothetical protein [Bacteroidota bacterium]
MKAIQKIIQYTLILAITLASAGFRVVVSDCSSETEKTAAKSNHSDCCCSKPEQKSTTSNQDCGLGTCVLPSSVYCSLNSRQSYEQVAKLLQPAPFYRVYTEVIYPALQEAQPNFSLPP